MRLSNRINSEQPMYVALLDLHARLSGLEAQGFSSGVNSGFNSGSTAEGTLQGGDG